MVGGDGGWMELEKGGLGTGSVGGDGVRMELQKGGLGTGGVGGGPLARAGSRTPGHRTPPQIGERKGKETENTNNQRVRLWIGSGSDVGCGVE